MYRIAGSLIHHSQSIAVGLVVVQGLCPPNPNLRLGLNLEDMHIFRSGRSLKGSLYFTG